MKLALVGNQNCGKTTLFNALTGANQHVGNFPGVTVEKKEGAVRRARDMTVVDLPGVYSLSPYTAEEVVTRDFILREQPDAIINIVDATALERSLYLTLQLLELSVPVVLVLNMMDEVRANGTQIDLVGLSAALGVDAVPISASRGEGLDALVRIAQQAAQGSLNASIQAKAESKLTAREKTAATASNPYDGEAGRAVGEIVDMLRVRAAAAELPALYAAVHALEGDEPVERLLGLSAQTKQSVERVASTMERALGTDREAAVADMRYRRIDRICAAHYRRGRVSRAQMRSLRIDKLLTHRYLALPVFALVMVGVFWLTFGPVGGVLSDLAARGIAGLTTLTGTLLAGWDVAPWLRSLVVEGAFAGVGGVLSFLPTILILFFLLSVLEDSGYMARVAFVMDKPLRAVGLSGRSIVPLLVGFGCSVPAVMATRTLPTERDRKMTALLVPFMSCSAKLPIYAMFTALFFEKHKTLVMASLYFLGVAVGVLYALFFKTVVFPAADAPFVLELPTYRFPSARNVWSTIRRRANDFLQKAFTVIFLASVAVWFLQRFDVRLCYVTDSAQSMLAMLGRLATPVFAPLGFGDWRAVTALLTGLTAKEAVVSTLSVLLASSGISLEAAIQSVFSPLSAYAYLVFTLFYMPCVAALAAIRRELGSRAGAALAMLAQLGIAWLMAFAVYRIVLLFL